MEIVATVSALIFPLSLGLADKFYRWLFQNSPFLSSELLLVIQILLSAALLLIPTIAMGSTIPLLAQLIVTVKKDVGNIVGRLYAVNIAGAVLGCFLAGFVLIRLAGLMGTLFIAAAINLIVALGGWILSRQYQQKLKPLEPHVFRSFSGLSANRFSRSMLLTAIFISGLVSIGYELIWMRSIVFLLGNFTYVFSTVLIIYLAGNVIGVWIGSRLSKRFANPTLGLCGSLIFLGILGINYPVLLVMWAEFIQNYIAPHFGGFMDLGFPATALPLLLSSFLFIFPSIMMGVGFPLALQAFSINGFSTGQSTGTVYGINTIGGVTGGILTAFFLIPHLGIQGSVIVLGLLILWTSTFLVQSITIDLTKYQRIASLVVATLMSLMIFCIPGDLMPRRLFNTENKQLVDYKEGVSATVTVNTVFGIDEQERLLSVSGTGIAGDGNEIRSAQKTLGHLGALLNPSAEKILTIGFGSGETTDCLVRHNLKEIDCVEISPEVVELSLQYFNHINLGDKLQDHVRMIYMDAKNYLHLTAKQYDLILNDADAPHNPGSSALFTKEHFQNAKQHLEPEGLFVTKLHVNRITHSSFDSILGTFLDVFPHVTVWFPTTKPYSMIYLVGSEHSQRFSIAEVRRNLIQSSIRQSLTHMNLQTDNDFFSWYIGDEHDLKHYLKTYHANSDNFPYVEFYLLQDVAGDKELLNQFITSVRQKDSLLKHITWSGISTQEKQRWLQYQNRLYDVSTDLLASHCDRNLLSRLQLIINALERLPENQALRDQEDKVLSIFRMKIGSGQIRSQTIHEAADNLLQQSPNIAVAWLLKCWAYQKSGEYTNSIDAANKALLMDPFTVAILETIGQLLLELQKPGEAVNYFQWAIDLKPETARLYYQLGIAYEQGRQVNEAEKSFRDALLKNPSYLNASLALKKY